MNPRYHRYLWAVLAAFVLTVSLFLVLRYTKDTPMGNQLQHASSPYLIQHADNPVHWFEWSDEAFELAKEQDKPIFLSIGYSTCHWCHVMEHESFEDEAVAALMNDTFINIKVDREERPDIDHLYMTVCQLLTGSGGWPLTIVMTPDKEPFFAGTYFPKHSRGNRQGMLDLIPSIKRAWLEDRDKIMTSTKQILTGIVQYENTAKPQALSEKILSETLTLFEQKFDETNGGFGTAPKFPTPHQLSLLVMLAQQRELTSQRESALSMLTKTLDAMMTGGIHDQVGYGFHRYSTDPSWHVPHFEKMLYDQAQLMTAYAQAYALTQNPAYKRTVETIFTYILDRLTHPEGGFYSAEDADSEGEEGTFYLWTWQQLQDTLSPEELTFLQQTFSVTQAGNYLDESTNEQTGQNILDPEKALSNQELTTFEPIRLTLKAKRETREAPGLDDKILTDWNGLMIAALATAGPLISHPDLLAQAEKAIAFINTHLIKKGQLLHRYRANNSGITATNFDYQFYIHGLIQTYKATQNSAYLAQAKTLFDSANKHFWSEADKGYIISDSDDLLIKQRDSYDGALPAANSVAYLNAIQLSQFLHDPTYYMQALSALERVGGSITRYPMGYTMWLQGVAALERGLPTLIVTKRPDDSTVAKLKNYRDITIQYLDKDTLSLLPKTVAFPELKQKTTYYFCENYTCQAPTTDAKHIVDLCAKTQAKFDSHRSK